MRLGYVILYVPNVAKSMDFYEQAFGLEKGFFHESGVFGEMATGMTKLAFCEKGLASESCAMPVDTAGEISDKRSSEIAFVIENVDQCFEKAVQAGAAPKVEPHDKPWGQRIAYVLDPDGNLVEICSPM